VRGARRASTIERWLARRAVTPLGKLALSWFRSYLRASQNSGASATLYIFLSVAPLLLASSGLFRAVGGDTHAFTRRIIEHQRLTGEVAHLVRVTFTTASHGAPGASVAALIGFLVWGVGVGQIYQDVYARAWRVRVRTLSDQARFTVWFCVFTIQLGVYIFFAGSLGNTEWAAGLPVWLLVSTVFWLWTPRFLLHGAVRVRALVPGALLASVLIGGATATSPLFLAPWLNSGGKDFGPFGVVIAILAWGLILVTVSMACIAFSPVWKEWRESASRPAAAAQSSRPERAGSGNEPARGAV
jgi:membrane protein